MEVYLAQIEAQEVANSVKVAREKANSIAVAVDTVAHTNISEQTEKIGRKAEEINRNITRELDERNKIKIVLR